MTVVYKPGDEIELFSPTTNGQAFYSTALSWVEQKEFAEVRRKIVEDCETDEEQVDAALAEICKRVTRTVPKMDMTPESLQQELDQRQIMDVFTSMRLNLTAEEKKS